LPVNEPLPAGACSLPLARGLPLFTLLVVLGNIAGSALRYPEIGAVAANVPTALTSNPLGAVATHVTMHVSSVVHQNQGGPAHMIPPRVTRDYPNHGSTTLAAGLAAGWLLATAGALTALVRRERRT